MKNSQSILNFRNKRGHISLRTVIQQCTAKAYHKLIYFLYRRIIQRFLFGLFPYARVTFRCSIRSLSSPAFVLETSSRYSKYCKPFRSSSPLTICEFSARSLRCSLPRNEFQIGKPLYQAIVEGLNLREPLCPKALLLRPMLLLHLVSS